MKYRHHIGWSAFVLILLGPLSIIPFNPVPFGLCDSNQLTETCRDSYIQFGTYLLLSFMCLSAISFLFFIFSGHNRMKLLLFTIIFLPITVYFIYTSESFGLGFPGPGEIIGWPVLVLFFLYLIRIALKELYAQNEHLRKIVFILFLPVLLVLVFDIFALVDVLSRY